MVDTIDDHARILIDGVSSRVIIEPGVTRHHREHRMQLGHYQQMLVRLRVHLLVIAVVLIGLAAVVGATIKVRVLFLVLMLRELFIVLLLSWLDLPLLRLPLHLPALNRLSILLCYHLLLLLLNLPDRFQVVVRVLIPIQRMRLLFGLRHVLLLLFVLRLVSFGWKIP